MSKKPRENRVPIMMSDDELREVDDWRFENRIATRSDAIRRLCRIGLMAEEALDDISDRSIAFHEKLQLLFNSAYQESRSLREEGETLDIARKRANELIELIEDFSPLNVQILTVYNRSAPMADNKSFEGALKDAEEQMQLAVRYFAERAAQEREQEENRIIAEVNRSWTSDERAAYEALSDDEKEAFWDRVMDERLGPRPVKDEQ